MGFGDPNLFGRLLLPIDPIAKKTADIIMPEASPLKAALVPSYDTAMEYSEAKQQEINANSKGSIYSSSAKDDYREKNLKRSSIKKSAYESLGKED